MNLRGGGGNLALSFLLSSTIHALIIAGIVYEGRTHASLSNTQSPTRSLGISLSQISDSNTRQEAASSAPKPPPKPPHRKKKMHHPKKKSIIQKPPCKECMHAKEESEEIPTPESEMAGNIQAQNDFTSEGGARSSGEASLEIVEGGANLSGLVLSAIKRHTTYPPRALELGLEGRVYVKFRLLNADEFEYIEIAKSSGYIILDKHVKQILKSAKKSLPKEAIGVHISVPIVFNIDHTKGER